MDTVGTVEEQARAAEIEFGLRIRGMRAAKRWTQEYVAEWMGAQGFPMHQTTVAKIESAARPTPVSELVALSILFETPIAELTAPVADPTRAEGIRLANVANQRSEELAVLDSRRQQLEAERDEAMQALKRLVGKRSSD